MLLFLGFLLGTLSESIFTLSDLLVNGTLLSCTVYREISKILGTFLTDIKLSSLVIYSSNLVSRPHLVLEYSPKGGI